MIHLLSPRARTEPPLLLGSRAQTTFEPPSTEEERKSTEPSHSHTHTRLGEERRERLGFGFLGVQDNLIHTISIP